MGFHRLGTCVTLARTVYQRYLYGSTTGINNATRVTASPSQLPRMCQYSAGSLKGRIARKQPIKLGCKAGKTYNWCACGLSSKQPLCDGSHKDSPQGLTPLRFTVSESKEYLFCQCKHTNKKPFCDGTHRSL